MAKYCLIFLISVLWLSQGFTKPFIGHHDWNGVFYSTIARNYLDYGLLTTKLGQMTLPGSFYTHYPPLLTLILALFFQLFGPKDTIACLVPLLFSSASITLLLAIGQKLKLKLWQSVAVLSLLLTPMLRYFAKMPSQEALMVFFSCLSVYAYLAKKTGWFYFSVVANGLSGWAGYFLYPFLLLKNRRQLIKTGLILLTIFCLHLLHTYWLTGQVAGGGLFEALLLRLGLYPQLGRPEPELAGQFSWPNYLFKQVRILTIYYTATLLGLSLVNIIFMLKKKLSKTPLSQLETLIFIFFGWGLSYPLIFPNVVFVHEYFNLFLAPFLALSLVNLIAYFKKISWPLLLVVFLIMFWERNKFYQALTQTAAFRPGYLTGLSINQLTLPGQVYQFFAPADFIESQQLFINFYSHRQIEYIKTNATND